MMQYILVLLYEVKTCASIKMLEDRYQNAGNFIYLIITEVNIKIFYEIILWIFGYIV